MQIALGFFSILGMAIAGGLIWLLLKEAGDIDRQSNFWLVRVVGLVVLILILLMVAIFLLIGGPILPALWDGDAAHRLNAPAAQHPEQF